MAIFEEKYINPLIKNMPILYLWYTDNIFIIWKGNYDDLTNFLDNITKQHRTMKLGVKKTVSFLDTKVYVDKDRFSLFFTMKLIAKVIYTASLSIHFQGGDCILEIHDIL